MVGKPGTELCDRAERLASALEVLTNLVFLTQVDAEAPDKIRFYMGLAEDQLNALQQICCQRQLWEELPNATQVARTAA